MTGVFSSSLDVIFSNDDFAVDATYKAGASPSVAVRARLRRPDSEYSIYQTGAVVAEYLADIRVSELTTAVEGATLTVGSTVYTVSKPEILDSDRLLWTLALHET